MGVHELPQPINWARIFETSDPPDLSRFDTGEDKGIRFHEWLQETFETESVPFERDLDWLTDPLEPGNRIDCFDGHFIYEFKTVYRLPDSPWPDDVDQLRNYLELMGIEFGVLVYVTRSDFTGTQFIVERN